MKKHLRVGALSALFVLSIIIPVGAGAQTTTTPTQSQPVFSKARITDVQPEVLDNGRIQQNISAEILQGDENGKTVQMQFLPTVEGGDSYHKGETIVVTKTSIDKQEYYFVVDHYRIPTLIYAAVAFVVLIIALARKRGLFALLGMFVSVGILAFYIVPRIVHNGNPLFVSIVGSIMIGVISLYIAHGLNRRTTIALISTLITIGLAIVLSIVFVNMTHLTGLGSEDAYFVQSGISNNINLRGLLLGGIIIGVLGILDDITTAQAAATEEIFKANRKLSFAELYKRSFSVGREHITSLVNTLVLAYAGASLPLFLLFTLNLQPWWVTLNSEMIAEEIIRTLVGSMTLTLAVPITTGLAAYYYTKTKHISFDDNTRSYGHSH